ncbi:MAG: ABC transporter ATP-binding protein [Clostridium sp.]|jgi:transporter|nr:ABC transporter ATP-binding protein [Clostridium sp.]
MENNIEVNNLSKKYDGFELKNINFAVPKGSIVGFVGENGAGKTTTIKSILNITNANGNIKILGKDIKQHEKEIKQNIGVVLDDSFLSDYLTAKQINSIMKDIYKEWNESKYINYLKQFNLPTNKLLKDYSSGMKMKLKIATAISHNPKLLILDEPTSGLDPVVRNEILDIFRNYIEEDETRSIFISTHITTDLEHISDYIVFIEKGEIIFNIPTAELLENYGIIKCSKEEFLNIDKQDYIRFKKEKYQYEVLTDNKENIIRKYNITTIDKPSIEDIMLLYVKGEK